jgi:hypothetical protein
LHERDPRKLTFGKRLLATRSLGEKILAFGNGLATESDALLGVEDATGTTIDLVKSDLVDDLGTVLPVAMRC